MQVDQLGAADGRQHGLQVGKTGLECDVAARNPPEAAIGMLIRQLGALQHLAAADLEYAQRACAWFDVPGARVHGFFSNSSAWMAK